MPSRGSLRRARSQFARISSRRTAAHSRTNWRALGSSGGADLAADGGNLPDGVPETARNQLAATLRRDADGLIAITTRDS